MPPGYRPGPKSSKAPPTQQQQQQQPSGKSSGPGSSSTSNSNSDVGSMLKKVTLSNVSNNNRCNNSGNSGNDQGNNNNNKGSSNAVPKSSSSNGRTRGNIDIAKFFSRDNQATSSRSGPREESKSSSSKDVNTTRSSDVSSSSSSRINQSNANNKPRNEASEVSQSSSNRSSSSRTKPTSSSDATRSGIINDGETNRYSSKTNSGTTVTKPSISKNMAKSSSSSNQYNRSKCSDAIRSSDNNKSGDVDRYSSSNRKCNSSRSSDTNQNTESSSEIYSGSKCHNKPRSGDVSGAPSSIVQARSNVTNSRSSGSNDVTARVSSSNKASSLRLTKKAFLDLSSRALESFETWETTGSYECKICDGRWELYQHFKIHLERLHSTKAYIYFIDHVFSEFTEEPLEEDLEEEPADSRNDHDSINDNDHEDSLVDHDDDGQRRPARGSNLIQESNIVDSVVIDEQLVIPNINEGEDDDSIAESDQDEDGDGGREQDREYTSRNPINVPPKRIVFSKVADISRFSDATNVAEDSDRSFGHDDIADADYENEKKYRNDDQNNLSSKSIKDRELRARKNKGEDVDHDRNSRDGSNTSRSRERDGSRNSDNSKDNRTNGSRTHEKADNSNKEPSRSDRRTDARDNPTTTTNTARGTNETVGDQQNMPPPRKGRPAKYLQNMNNSNNANSEVQSDISKSKNECSKGQDDRSKKPNRDAREERGRESVTKEDKERKRKEYPLTRENDLRLLSYQNLMSTFLLDPEVGSLCKVCHRMIPEATEEALADHLRRKHQINLLQYKAIFIDEKPTLSSISDCCLYHCPMCSDDDSKDSFNTASQHAFWAHMTAEHRIGNSAVFKDLFGDIDVVHSFLACPQCSKTMLHSSEALFAHIKQHKVEFPKDDDVIAAIRALIRSLRPGRRPDVSGALEEYLGKQATGAKEHQESSERKRKASGEDRGNPAKKHR